MSTISKTVYVGRDNTFDLTFSSIDAAGVETPFDFSAVYSITLELLGSGIAAAEYTSLITGAIVDASPGSGVLRLRLGQIVGLPIGAFPLRLSSKSSAGDASPTQLAHERAETPIVVEVVPFTSTFTAEDGTGLADAMSYATVAEADAYHRARRNLAWTQAASVDREAALVRATDYIDRRWSARFIGRRLTVAQALEWPRDFAYDEFGGAITGVPTLLKNACAEYALRALTASLAPDPVLSANGRITRKLERVEGAVTEETEYAADHAPPITRPYPLADMLLRRYVAPLEFMRG